MKSIGIYTYHAETNFGAQLQAYATQKFLADKGYSVELVNLYSRQREKSMHYRFPWNSIKGTILNIMAFFMPAVRRKIRNINSFHSEMRLSKRFFSEKEYMEKPIMYDIHLVGSDQVWNIEHGISDNPFFFLSFLPNEAIRISYASSFGNTNVRKDLYPRLKELLLPFKAISTRERGGVDLIYEASGLKATHVLDPTFLLTMQQWNEIILPDRIIKTKYILYYGFDRDEKCKKMIDTISLHLRLPVVGVSVSLTSPYKFDHFVMDAGPREFLRLIRDAEYVVTSSFHGLALAINFRRNFVVIKHGTRMSRMESILEQFGLTNRIVSSVDELKKLLMKDAVINYEKCENMIEKSVVYSRQWLLNNI